MPRSIVKDRRWLVLCVAALVALSLALTAAAGNPLAGKWEVGEGDVSVSVEFSGGVVFFRDQMGRYTISGDRLIIDNFGGRAVSMRWRVEGDTLTLTDDDGGKMVFKRAGR
jgi:hypothetical protein